MSDLAGIEEIGRAAARIEIDGPDREPDLEELDAVKGRFGPEALATERAAVGIPAIALPPDEPELFDSSVYVEAVSFDGQAADEIVVAFSGQIKYSAADLEGRKLFDGLTLGREVELRVAGVVAGKTGSYKVSARDEEKVTGKAQVKVDTVYLLSPEELAG